MKSLRYLIILLLVSCTTIPKEMVEIIETPSNEIDNKLEIIFYDPVEKNDPNTNLLPSFKGQTRIDGIKTSSAITSSIISDQLENPWGIDVLPDNKFIVTERKGFFVILDKDGTILNKIPLSTQIDTSGQGGLLDVLVSLDFNESHIVYVSLAEKTSQGSITAVGKARLASDLLSISEFEIIYRAYPYFQGSNHYGSRIVFDQDENLFVSTGDRQSLETRPNAQTLDNGHGKILHITADGLPVNTNPFLLNDSSHKEIFSLGHRNIQGLAIHPVTGDLWANEMGPQGGDELNLIQSGHNYGWPIISYGEEYDGAPIGAGISQKDGLEQPVYYWDPVIAPSGMIFYDSNIVPEWEYNLFISGLKSQHIIRLLIKDNKVIGEERLLEHEGERFRDITVGLDGALYTISDGGKLYRLGQ